MRGRMILCVLMLFVAERTTGTDMNHALGKPTTSSSAENQGPSSAVDGKKDTYWSSLSCFSVDFGDRDQWWQVDLQYQVLVEKITVSSRLDCCPDRLHDFSVDMYDTDPSVNPHATAKQCYFYSGSVTSPGVTVTVTCTRPVNGRYLRLTGKNRTDDEDVLQFCEVQVFGDKQTHFGSYMNHALGKPTTSSSAEYQGPSSAVDGKNDTHWSSLSCFSVDFGDRDQWWQVDLQYQVLVEKITVSSRLDCCPYRLHDFSVDMYDTDPSVNPHATAKQCYFYSGSVTSPGVTVTVTCTRPVNGRYLRLTGKKRADDEDVLQFCEVQVFGAKQTHFSSCSTLKPQRAKRFRSAFVQDLQSDVADPAACASVCERYIRCTGFNFKLTEKTCQLVLDTEIGSTVADTSWNCYQYEPCWVPCPAV